MRFIFLMLFSTTAFAQYIDPATDTKLCMRPPLNHAPEDDFKKVFEQFFGGCEFNLDVTKRKRICIPIAPQPEIDRLNSELSNFWALCPEPKPSFLPPATSNCQCRCAVYHGKGINYCTDSDLDSWKIN